MYTAALDLQVISGDTAGTRVLLSQIDLTPSDTTLKLALKRLQFPIKLAFAITKKNHEVLSLKSSNISFDLVMDN